MISFKSFDNLPPLVSVTPAVDKAGNCRLLVTFRDHENRKQCISFEHMSSVCDFIVSNFNRKAIFP